ncbi:MAG: sodium:solute symporter family transporter, partial [Blastocatellia bacterium]
ILIVGALTLIYTFEGGISAVIWTDLIQLIIYVGGAVIAAYELIKLIPGGWGGFVATAGAAGKFQVFSFSWDFSSPFTFWGGVIGGTFLTLASHGTDQLIVQRLLACRSRGDSQKALILSGFVVFVQFALFLGIGAMLFAYYSHDPLAQPLTTSDQVFPAFIVQRLPHGIAGLVIAAIFAAAMSNLSGSLNALSSSTLMDFYEPAATGKDGAALLRLSRWFTAAWGVVLICIAVAARGWGSVFTTGLTIASIVYGPMLGVFLLGLLVRRATQVGAICGMAASFALMICIKLFSNLAWTWYVVVGTAACVLTGYLVSIAVGQTISAVVVEVVPNSIPNAVSIVAPDVAPETESSL